MSIADYLETVLLDLVFNASAYAGQSTVYVKLHTGDPGDAGTSNAAGNTTRAAVTFAAASNGSIASDTAATWTNVSTSETYSYISLWDASVNGNCLWTGALSAPVVIAAGDTFSVASGSLTVAVD